MKYPRTPLRGGNTMIRKLKCLLGFHAEDCVRAEVGGRNVQRCLYCDKVIREYTVTKDGAQGTQTIRRKY